MNHPSDVLTADTIDALLERAREARLHAYAPYSGFRVGAALLLEDGRIVTGCNVENVSFGLTRCAEQVAVGTAVAQGSRAFRAIAVAAPEGETTCTPCGSCLQVLHEFAPDIRVVTAGAAAAAPRVQSLRELLPQAFRADRLKASTPDQRALP